MPPKVRPKTLAQRQHAHEVVEKLRDTYPNAVCALEHKNSFELLAATILSAQCTDKRVNLVTPALFRTYPTAQALAQAELADVEELVRTCGFYKNKSKSLIGMATQLVALHQGKVPKNMSALIALPGVARKTANVVLGVAYNIAQGVVVDTHVARLSKLLGLTKHDSPVQVEQDLMLLIPQQEWIQISHRMIEHGRQICIARRPQCSMCPLKSVCPSNTEAAKPRRISPKPAAARRSASRGVAES